MRVRFRLWHCPKGLSRLPLLRAHVCVTHPPHSWATHPVRWVDRGKLTLQQWKANWRNVAGQSAPTRLQNAATSRPKSCSRENQRDGGRAKEQVKNIPILKILS